MAKIGKATMDEPRAQDPTAAAARQREDLKRAIEAGVLGPLRAAQEGVDPSIDKPEKKDEPDLDLGMPVDVPAQEDARSWEEALVKMKKQKTKRVAAPPPKPAERPKMESFIKSLLGEEGQARAAAEEAEGPRDEETRGETETVEEDGTGGTDQKGTTGTNGTGPKGGDFDGGGGTPPPPPPPDDDDPGDVNTDIYADHLPEELQDDPAALKAAAEDAARKQYDNKYANKDPSTEASVEIDGEDWTKATYPDGTVWNISPDGDSVLRSPDKKETPKEQQSPTKGGRE